MLIAWEEAEIVKDKQLLYDEISARPPGKDQDPMAGRRRISAFQRALETDHAARFTQYKKSLERHLDDPQTWRSRHMTMRTACQDVHNELLLSKRI
jgi:hypothetical protein